MSQITNRELYEEINKLRLELVTRDEHLEDKVDQTYLKIQVFEAKMEAIGNEYGPIKKLVFGLVSICLAAFLTAVLGLILRSA